MNKQMVHDQLAASLYLRAVLPAFEELGRVSSRAQSLIDGWDCGVEFAVRGNGGAAIRFQNGSVSVSPNRCLESTISLFFLSSRQLVKMFSGRGLSFPLPRRGWWRAAGLQRFLRLAKILEQELERHPRLMLGVALGTLQPLIEHDRRARELMRDCPGGLAELGVPAQGLYAWVEWDGGEITWSRGRAPRAADVIVSFRDAATALGALRGDLDEMAAIGRGDLIVRGLVPLAETLGLVMALADNYVQRRLPQK